MSVDQDQRPGVAADLSGRPPDADLVAMLDGLDPSSLTGEDLAAYVRARWQLHNRAEAQLLRGLRELGTAQDGQTARLAHSDEFSGDEACALFGWSRTMASRRMDLADDLFDRLPALGDALWQGWIDEPKVRAMAETVADLGDDLARHAVGEVLPEAPELPVMALRERLERVAIALDPDWAERRRKRAEARGRVMLTANPSGTATLSFVDGPAEDQIDSHARIEALAAAVRQLGVLTPVGPLRLHIGMRLLNGSTAGMQDRDIILMIAAEHHAGVHPDDAAGGGGQDGSRGDGTEGDEPGDGSDDAPNDGPEPGPDDKGPNDKGPDDGPGDCGPVDGPGDCGPDDGPGDSGPDDGPGDRGPDDGPGDCGPDDSGPDDTGPVTPHGGPAGGAARPEGDGESVPACPPSTPAAQRTLDLPGLPAPPQDADAGPITVAPPRAGQLRQGTVEVRLRLTTALGLDECPGSVPGFGAVTGPLARTLLHARHHGEWRVVLTDPGGHLHHVLLARRRPDRPPDPRHPTRARGRSPGATRTAAIVELQVPTTLLAALNPDDHPGWAPLLTELRERVTELEATGRLGRPPDADLDPEQWRRRRAGAETERWIRARDRSCVAPWCRRPAHRAEIDHTRDHARGGPTMSWNLGAWCCHDHRAKHLAGWTVRQPLPGWFVIRTRAGILHTTTPKKTLEPLPEPRPASEPRPLPDDGWSESSDHEDPDWRSKITAKLAGRRPTLTTPRTPTTPTTAPAPQPPSRADDPPPF